MTRMKCPRCSGRVIKCGGALRKGGKKQRYQCTVCGYPFVPEDKDEIFIPDPDPTITAQDIEDAAELIENRRREHRLPVVD